MNCDYFYRIGMCKYARFEVPIINLKLNTNCANTSEIKSNFVPITHWILSTIPMWSLV